MLLQKRFLQLLEPKILISLQEKSITSVSTSPTSVKMYCLKGICLLIVILANLADCQTDDSHSEESGDYEYSGDDYEYPEYPECENSCDYYDDVKCAKECHHNNFREVTPLKELFGDKVKMCCSGHRYYFMDSCEV